MNAVDDAASDGGARQVRNRQIVLSCILAAVLLTVLAVWLAASGGRPPAPAARIATELVGPGTAEDRWTRLSEGRLGLIETRLREMQAASRRLEEENTRLRVELRKKQRPGDGGWRGQSTDPGHRSRSPGSVNARASAMNRSRASPRSRSRLAVRRRSWPTTAMPTAMRSQAWPGWMSRFWWRRAPRAAGGATVSGRHFRSPGTDMAAGQPEAEWLEAMAQKLAGEEGRALHRLRQQTVEPVFAIIKAVPGFRRFSMRGLDKLAGEWDLVALACNCKRLHEFKLAMAS